MDEEQRQTRDQLSDFGSGKRGTLPLGRGVLPRMT